MKSHRLPALIALAVGIAATFAACKKAETAAPVSTTNDGGVAAAPVSATESAPAAVRITSVDLGKALGPDKKVQAAVTTFAPGDTIFASVATDGAAPAATIYAKWTFQDGQTVKSDSRAIAPAGPAVTEFSIQNPSGWPKGGYKVDVSVGSAGTAVSKSFRVE
jgi:hypothetical protein